jgi:hypothetical protein
MENGEESVVGPFSDWVVDEDEPFEALSCAQVEYLREVLNSVAHQN